MEKITSNVASAYGLEVKGNSMLFEKYRNEIKNLLYILRTEKEFLKNYAAQVNKEINGKRLAFYDETNNERQQINKQREKLEFIRRGLYEIAKQRQIGFPWLAEAHTKLYKIADSLIVNQLHSKKNPALKAAEEVKKQSEMRREYQKKLMIAEGKIAYYESIAPFLVDMCEEVQVDEERDLQPTNLQYSDEEKADSVIQYLTIEEYRKLSESQRNQLALERYWKRKKTKWMVGRDYERYVGYLYESQGYEVEYQGILEGLSDLGRDLVCRKNKEIIVIQCKNWSQFKTIHEKHVFQLFGTVYQYKVENPDKDVKSILFTTTQVSELAKRFANDLGIDIRENEKFERTYPSIKCNISRTSGEKIYHLPMDQQYDKIKVEPDKGEFYCSTVAEAESKGFRRAKKYYLKKNS